MRIRALLLEKITEKIAEKITEMIKEKITANIMSRVWGGGLFLMPHEHQVVPPVMKRVCCAAGHVLIPNLQCPLPYPQTAICRKHAPLTDASFHPPRPTSTRTPPSYSPLHLSPPSNQRMQV
jgi:hypothetical protein